MQQLKAADLKGFSESETKAALSMEVGGVGYHGLDVMDQVNELNLDVEEIFYNSPAGVLYEQALQHEAGSAIVSSGALAVTRGKKTGRSPLDKRVVEEEGSVDDVWWGKVNVKLDYKPFITNHAGCFPANRQTDGMTSSTSIAVSFKRKEMVILGTQYAGEMKKGVFTVMNYLMPLMPKRDLPPAERALPLHASANIGPDNDVSIFFGLSGTGKTTLSADPKRDLIGDDEHVWHTKGVFNIEGGCYAKTIGLTREKEPEIYDAIRYGSILENVCWDESTGDVDYDDVSLTENTRVSYPLQFMPNARIPAKVDHQPKQIIFLTCDAFGVLPPIAKLTSDQVMYHFIAGYTAKVAGTEEGVTEPQATFSACFGAPFLVWHPYVYAEMLAAKLALGNCPAYLVNTGWVGGPYGTGARCSLKYTRQLIDAIHNGGLDNVGWDTMPIFGLQIPTDGIKDVPKHILRPEEAWVQAGSTSAKFKETANMLAGLFNTNFKEFEDKCSAAVIAAGPKQP